MATFAYVGRTRSGAVKKGELSAKTRDEAVDQLRKQSVVVTSLDEKKGGGGIKISFGSGLTDKDLVVFTRQFGTMINAGLPLVQCLEILSTQSENKVLRTTIGEVKTQVEAGSTFSDALRRHPKVFDDLYVNMVHAGEVGGLLDTILTRLAKHIEKAMKLKGQIKSAIFPSMASNAPVDSPTAIICVTILGKTWLCAKGSAMVFPPLMLTRAFMSVSSITLLPEVLAQMDSPSRRGTPLDNSVPSVRVNLATEAFLIKSPTIGTLRRNLSICILP